MKQELIWLTKSVLQSIIDVWDKAEERKIVSYKLSMFVTGDIADIMDILDNCEKYE